LQPSSELMPCAASSAIAPSLAVRSSTIQRVGCGQSVCTRVI
jgi:hypothetical protein